MVITSTTQNFERDVLKSTQPVIVAFYATWCGPCKMLGPVFEEVSNELGSKYRFVKINIDEERDIAVSHNVSSIPTIIFVKDGKIIGRETGFMNKDGLKQKIESYFEK